MSSEKVPEVQRKLARLRKQLAAHSADGILINQVANAAWITAGAATYVNEATDGGASSVLITHDKAYLLTDNIEGPRLRDEEMVGDLGFQFLTKTWHSAENQAAVIMSGKKLLTEADFGGELRSLRSELEPEELDRFRQVGKLASDAMNVAVRAVRPGDTEFLVAARLAAAGRERGGLPIVNLIASDERIYRYRHPLPTAKQVERYAMLVLCLRVEGLVASVTRFVHFGPMPAELRKRVNAVARIDAAINLGTQAGRTIGDLFEIARSAYTAEGYADSINEHHQGGTAAYNPREIIATSGDKTPIVLNQAFAWNPSVSGSKSEDTILLTAKGVEVITVTNGWPTIPVAVDGQTIERPAVLEV